MMAKTNRPLLVTGGAGFIGANLADRCAGQGRQVIVFDNLSRPGVEENLHWLQERHGDLIIPRIADIRSHDAVAAAVAEAGAVVHLAAQVAVTTSLSDPVTDFTVNAGGTLCLLEAIRRSPAPPPLVFASTNKVYGDLSSYPFVKGEGGWQPAEDGLPQSGVAESQPLDLHTPYGCSKGVADQYVLDYARQYGLPMAVLRMSCIYGPRQFGTEDQGWVAHFLLSILRKRKITLFGDGHQVRDILHVSDAVDAYLALLGDMDGARGHAFNLGGGTWNAVSLRQLIAEAEKVTGRRARLSHEPVRAGDQRYFVADTAALYAQFGWEATIGWRDGLSDLWAWLEELSAWPKTEHKGEAA